MKVGIFKLISWGFSIRDEINKAFKDDKKISAKEMLTMYTNLSEKIKLPVDSKVQKTLDLISEIVDELTLVTDDNKVSIAEIITFIYRTSKATSSTSNEILVNFVEKG